MTRNQFFVVLAVYLLGIYPCVAWAMSNYNVDQIWSAPGLLGLTLWTSFFGFCNAVGWVTYWSREHWMG